LTSGVVRPRAEQVAELTRGLQIPFEPLPEVNLKIIAEVISSAWNDLLRTRREVLFSGQEAEVNALIASRLNSLLDEDTAWSVLVRGVTRGAETISYDGSHLEKRPDLSIHLTGRNPSFALIVECKILDHGCGKRTDMYCTNGLARFVRGEYAWACREAFMLAYVRDESRINTSLNPFLAEKQNNRPDPFQTVTLPEMISDSGLHLARSSHNRDFRYVGQPSQSLPGPISIWHVWVLITRT
jgi:hypothetical protein